MTDNVEKINTKNPLENIAKQLAEQEARALNERLKKELAEVTAAKKVFRLAAEKALATSEEIKALQSQKPINLAHLVNSLGE